MSDVQATPFINGWTREKVIEHIDKNFTVRSTTMPGTPHGTCMYRGGNGAKCAVGLFIPDESYYEDMERCGSYENLIVCFPWIKNYMPMTNEHMQKLQLIHDCPERNGLGDFDSARVNHVGVKAAMLAYVEGL